MKQILEYLRPAIILVLAQLAGVALVYFLMS
jgi:hypothetical protein